jgi:hypothetical protein
MFFFFLPRDASPRTAKLLADITSWENSKAAQLEAEHKKLQVSWTLGIF